LGQVSIDVSSEEKELLLTLRSSDFAAYQLLISLIDRALYLRDKISDMTSQKTDRNSEVLNESKQALVIVEEMIIKTKRLRESSPNYPFKDWP